MQIDPDVLAKIAGPIISLIGGALKIYMEGKSSLVSFIGHVSSFTLTDEQHTVVHTHSVVVINAGRKTAKNVRLTHAFLPINYTVYPPVHHTIERNPDNTGGEIVFPVLVPKEQVTISYLYFPPLLWNHINSNIKSDDGFAKIIDVIPSPQPNRLVIAMLWALVFVGASFTFYWLIRLIISLL